LLLALEPSEGREEFRYTLPAPVVAPVAEFREWVLVPTRSPAGWLMGLKFQRELPVFSLRLDTALLTRPVVVGEQLFVAGQDGRVFSWRLQPPKP
jgi:outer membrane protein assembly factor BamB